MTPKIKFIAVTILGVLALSTATILWLPTSKADLDFYGFPMKLLFSKNSISKYTHQSEHERLQLTSMTAIDQTRAGQLVREKIFLFSSLFEKQRVGYKGQHTEFVECNEKFKPVLKEHPIVGGKLVFFAGFSNDRFVPGACDTESAAWQYLNFLFYCEASSTFLDGEYFLNIESIKPVHSIIENFSCG